MIDDEDFNEEDETNYKLYAQTLNYHFDPQQYVIQSTAGDVRELMPD